jgi:hypothetical protein
MKYRNCEHCKVSFQLKRNTRRFCESCSIEHRLVLRRVAMKRRVHTYGSREWSRRRYEHIRDRAYQKGIPFNITTSDIQELAKPHKCHFCKIKRGIFTLDRLNNDLGYAMDNLALACWPCNVIKANLFTESEMMILGPAIRKLRMMRGHSESDYYLLGLGQIIKKAAFSKGRYREPIPKPARQSPGRPSKIKEPVQPCQLDSSLSVQS